MTMGEISSEIIKECRGKHRALCSFCVTISVLRINYKNSNLENTLLLSEDAAFHARWTFLCLSANSHCWLDVKSKANPEHSRSAADAFLSEAASIGPQQEAQRGKYPPVTSTLILGDSGGEFNLVFCLQRYWEIERGLPTVVRGSARSLHSCFCCSIVNKGCETRPASQQESQQGHVVGSVSYTL